MSSWFRVDADMPDHPKTRALGRRLPGVDPVGLVARTWAWMSRFCRTGHVVTCHVTPFAESIASSIGWTGDPSELVSGLCDSGWLDRHEDGSIEAHDWDEKQSKVASKAEKDRERQRAYRAKKKASVTRDTCDSHAATVTPVTPLRNETERDGTRRDETEKEDPRVAVATPPGLEGELFESPPPQPTPPPLPLKSKPPKPADPHPLQVVWNANRAPSMPEWRETGKTRRKHADARLEERPLDEWVAVVKRLAASDFASGRSGQWAASPDFFVQPDSANKVLEGAYDNRVARRPGDPSDWSGVPAGCREIQL